MKLIRWLLSNIVLIAFVLAITYAYVYWDNLTGEDTPAGKAIAYLSVEYDEVREFLDGYDFGDGEADVIGAAEPVAEATETASVPQVMPPPRSLPPQSQPQQALPPQARQQQAASQQPYQQPYPSQGMMQPPTARQQQPVSQPSYQQRLPPQAMMQPAPPARRPVAPEPMQAPPAPAETAAQTGDSESDLRALWISAREEYHRGNIAQSIDNYQQVIANSSDNYDAYGELGNVYLSRGKYREAAGAYYQAAAILVKQGQMGRARSLLPMLERLDRTRAEELNQLMNAPRS